MGWEGVIAGEVTLPEERFDDWLDLEIDRDTFDDWPEEMIGSEIPETTVQAVLDAARESGEPLKFWIDGDTAHVRAILNGDSYGLWIGMIATALRLAGPVGGKAEVIFGDALSEEGYLMRVDAQQTTFEKLDVLGEKKIHRQWLDEAWQDLLGS